LPFHQTQDRFTTTRELYTASPRSNAAQSNTHSFFISPPPYFTLPDSMPTNKNIHHNIWEEFAGVLSTHHVPAQLPRQASRTMRIGKKVN
jgi:hypothetical protein